MVILYFISEISTMEKCSSWWSSMVEYFHTDTDLGVGKKEKKEILTLTWSFQPDPELPLSYILKRDAYLCHPSGSVVGGLWNLSVCWKDILWMSNSGQVISMTPNRAVNTFLILLEELPRHSAQWMWSTHKMQSLLSLLFFTGRKPELSSNIKEKFVDLCKKHGIVEENILDLTGVGKSRLIYFSLPKFYIMINPRDCQPDIAAEEASSFSWGNKVVPDTWMCSCSHPADRCLQARDGGEAWASRWVIFRWEWRQGRQEWGPSKSISIVPQNNNKNNLIRNIWGELSLWFSLTMTLNEWPKQLNKETRMHTVYMHTLCSCAKMAQQCIKCHVSTDAYQCVWSTSLPFLMITSPLNPVQPWLLTWGWTCQICTSPPIWRASWVLSSVLFPV